MAQKRERRDMAQETNQSQAALLCSTGCGFYSMPRSNGMCSVCYRDFIQRQNTHGCVSPPGSSTDGSIAGSSLVQFSNSVTVSSPGGTSGPTPTSTNSTERLSGAKTSLMADCLPGSSISDKAAAVDSEQQGQCSVLRNVTVGKKCSHKSMKRKVEANEKIDVKTASGSDTPSETEEKPKGKKKRCFMCRKKIGLTGFNCRCGNEFCCIHRYSDIHNCTFDYKADAAEKIRKENPVIVGEKFQQI